METGENGAHDEEEDGAADHRGRLKSAAVAAVEGLQFVIGESIAVQQPGKGHFPVSWHRVHSVIHFSSSSSSLAAKLILLLLLAGENFASVLFVGSRL